MESKNDIIDQRKELYNEYACIRMKSSDASDVLFKNKKELNKLEEYTVSIGNQIWMTQNLNVDRFRNGDPIPQD